jgi:hypothetical protein
VGALPRLVAFLVAVEDDQAARARSTDEAERAVEFREGRLASGAAVGGDRLGGRRQDPEAVERLRNGGLVAQAERDAVRVKDALRRRDDLRAFLRHHRRHRPLRQPVVPDGRDDQLEPELDVRVRRRRRRVRDRAASRIELSGAEVREGDLGIVSRSPSVSKNGMTSRISIWRGSDSTSARYNSSFDRRSASLLLRGMGTPGAPIGDWHESCDKKMAKFKRKFERLETLAAATSSPAPSPQAPDDAS